MSLSPASFRRRLAYDVINDYVFPAVDTSREGLEERNAKALLLPGFIVSILQKLKERKLREVIAKCIETYRGIVDLPELSENDTVITWYRKCLEKREDETIQDWIMKVAIASHCILSYACIEEAVMPEPAVPMI